jgi:hypothetical protein
MGFLIKVCAMILFDSIVRGTIFGSDFRTFSKNNTISFPSRGKIAVLYGPNGTGKTSLACVLRGIEDTSVSYVYKRNTYTDPTSTFHVINDQNSRNIIEGNPDEFFLGDNIRKEFVLKEYIDTTYATLAKEIADTLKKTFGISAIGNPLLTFLPDSELADLLKNFVNVKRKGEDVRSLENLDKLASFPCEEIALTEVQKAQLQFLQHDYVQKDSIIQQIEKLTLQTIVANTKVLQVEENTEAIKILERFHKNQCIVCDTVIDWKNLLATKTTNRDHVLAKLEETQKALLESVIDLVPSEDPFLIKKTLLSALASGATVELLELKEVFEESKKLVGCLVLQMVSSILNNSDLLDKMKEYESLLEQKLEIEQEDLSYIESIIKYSMDKNLSLVRDDRKNIVVTLEDIPVLGEERNKLPLSTGEQNFLSLSFEFLKAKNSTAPIVVIDDPVSSFDSIYKNKVAYAMVKMLEGKKRLILTHNTDLLRLFEAQYRGCYKLYLLNNTPGGENGFIPVSKDEQKLLINLRELVDVFRSTIFPSITNQKLFLVSMIPFMRGYASITHKKKWFNKLTSVMHGSMTETVDIAQAYTRVFGITRQLPFSAMKVSVPEILKLPVDNLQILDCSKYPLLDKTLRHSYMYLYLRLQVEKKLIETFPISGSYDQLGSLIVKAFPRNDPQYTKQRVFLTSKKTLLNEFNHFEGNLSIFQPAIDISDQMLQREKDEILQFLENL